MSLPRRVRRWSALGLALAAATFTLAAAPAAPPQQATTIQITVSGNSIQVSNPRAMVGRGEAITWSANAPFAIVVERQGSLFPGVPAQALSGLANRPAQARVGGNTPPGRYKYSVVVWNGSEMRVLDPEIIVRPN